MYNHFPSYEMHDGAPTRLTAVPWHTEPGQQRRIVRLGGSWLDAALALAFDDKAKAWNPRAAVRHGHIVTDGSKRAVLYLAPSEEPTARLLAQVAQAEGMEAVVPPADVPEPMAEHREEPRGWAPFTADITVAYAGSYEPSCLDAPVFLEARAAFPLCPTCNKRVQWRPFKLDY